MPVYIPTDPCREAVNLQGTADVLTQVSLDPTTRAITNIRLFTNLANAVGTGTQRTYHAVGSAKAVCAPTDPCYDGNLSKASFQNEFDLIPTTGACAATTVRVTGSLFFRPDGTIADGTLAGDPFCSINDTVGVQCSGFAFAPTP